MALDFKSGNKGVNELNKRVSVLKDDVVQLQNELRVFRERVQEDMKKVIEQLNRR